MSRIGKSILPVVQNATVTIANDSVVIKGPKGELSMIIPVGFVVKNENNVLTVDKQTNAKKSDALHGYVRAQLGNMMQGVTQGWTKTLELSGVGYRAVMQGPTLVLTVGFSHPVNVTPPEGVTLSVVDGKIVVSGIDKQVVGQQAAKIREVKKPEPYKGKGIKYVGEVIRKKAGKAAKAVGGAK